MQIPVLIIGHGDFPTALIDSASMLMGEREDVFPLCLREGDGLENFMQKVADLVTSFNPDVPLMVFVDLQGGTPWNAVLGVNEPRVRLVTGINLPMLLEVLLLRDSTADVDQLVACSLETARVSVTSKAFN
jgi:mannose/fructose/sorbose-specific phosphotransferase system IIA component